MKILVLSRNQALYSTRRLVQAGNERGHQVEVIDYLRAIMDISANRPQIFLQGRHLENYDAVIPRIGATNTFYGTAVVRQFQEAGVYTLNNAAAISRSRDKLRSMQIMAGAGINLPTTAFGHSSRDVDGLIDIVGGAPLVVKLLEGTHGHGVVLAETREAAESVIAAFRQLDANFLVQEFVAESHGVDVRALVVGGQVVAAMERRAKAGEFRANLHQGGTVNRVVLTEQEHAAAIKAAKAMGLNVAGVDLLRSERGPVVLEVNSSPGLEGIERASGRDVANRIIQFIEKNAKPGRKDRQD